MPTVSEPNKNNINYYLHNKTIFKEQLQHATNSKRLKIKLVIIGIIMFVSVSMGLIFAAKDIFIISSLLGLFGQHLVAYNVVNLIGYILGGGLISFLVSYKIDNKYINKVTKDIPEEISLVFSATKVAEITVMPLVYAIRDLGLKNPTYKTYADYYKNRLIDNLMSDKFSYTEDYTKELMEQYFQMDLEDLAEKIRELNFKIESNGIKLDLSYFKRLFKKNLRLVINPKGEKEKDQLLKEEEKKVSRLLKGKTEKEATTQNDDFSKTKKKKTTPLDHLDDAVKKYQKVHETEDSDNLKEQKLIEIKD